MHNPDKQPIKPEFHYVTFPTWQLPSHGHDSILIVPLHPINCTTIIAIILERRKSLHGLFGKHHVAMIIICNMQVTSLIKAIIRSHPHAVNWGNVTIITLESWLIRINFSASFCRKHEQAVRGIPKIWKGFHTTFYIGCAAHTILGESSGMLHRNVNKGGTQSGICTATSQQDKGIAFTLCKGVPSHTCSHKEMLIV